MLIQNYHFYHLNILILLFIYICTQMQPSMVDYVLEKGTKDYGQFYKNNVNVDSGVLLNQRKLLEYLFSPEKQIKKLKKKKDGVQSISDLKYSQILTQYTVVAEKIHHDINRRNVILDGQIYKMQNQWYKKKIPEFYCYYFLKFAYANPVHKVQRIIFEENSNLSRENDTYNVIRKAIQARESCLANLKKQSNELTVGSIQQDLRVIQQEIHIQAKVKLKQQMKGIGQNEQNQKGWKNNLQIFFEGISHLRKLTLYIIDLIRKWKNHIYSLTEDPKRYRERIIFYHSNVNYLLKMLIDNRFLSQSALKQYLSFGENYDPFVLRPLIVLENKKKTTEEIILYNLLKPKQGQMEKIVKSLELLAEEEYDQDTNSRFLNQKKNFGELDFKKTVAAEKTLEFQQKSPGKNFRISNSHDRLKKVKSSLDSRNKKYKILDPMNSGNKFAQMSDSQKKIQFSNKNKYMSSASLKKISPYLTHNDKIQKAKLMDRFLQPEPKIGQFVQSNTTKNANIEGLKFIESQKLKQEKLRSPINSSIPEVEDIKKFNENKIFNRYIQQNLRKIQQSEKKKYNKNKIYQPRIKIVQEIKQPIQNRSIKLEKIEDKKRDDKISLQLPKGLGPKTIIEISNEGIIKRQKTFSIANSNIKRLGDSHSKNNQYQKKILQRLHPDQTDNAKLISQFRQNVISSQTKPEILVLKQEPQKLEQIKNYLYNKIKQQLMNQMIKQNGQKQDLNNLIEQQKRKRISEMIDRKLLQQQKRKQQEQKRLKQQMQIQRNKVNPEMTVEVTQHTQENLHEFIEYIFKIQPSIYNTLFDTNQINFLKSISQNLYNIFFKIMLKQQEIGYAFAVYDDSDIYKRKFIIKYVAISHSFHFISVIHHVLTYIWSCDPAQEIEIVLIENLQSGQGERIIKQMELYTLKNGQIFQKQLYSNMIQKKFVFLRNYSDFPDQSFQERNNVYSKTFHMKIQLLSANSALTENHPSKMDLNLEQNTHYMFLIEELFRGYLTPEQVIQLRQNTKNLRRLKDIFKIILDLQKNNPKVHQLKILEGLSLQDLFEKIKQNTKQPYSKYYWKDYLDKINSNRLILAILQVKLQFTFPINSAILNEKYFMRMHIKDKVLILKSSVYPQDLIYVIPTKNEKLKLFLVRSSQYKQMRIQLFTFLNLLFNNIILDDKHYVDSIWLPQLFVGVKSENADKYCKKEITRVTDFSITMKKNIWLSQEIYFCNKEYIRNGITIVPQESDEIFLESFIYGVIHSDVEKQSVGVPIFGKLIEKQHLF